MDNYRLSMDNTKHLLESRQRRIAEVTQPLPGSLPHDHWRPLNVPQRFDRFTLLDFLDGRHPHHGRDYWEKLCEEGRIIYQEQPAKASKIVRGGERYSHCLPAVIEPEVNVAIRILYEDDAFILVHKPAPLPMHPCGRFNRNSLLSILNQVYEPVKLLPIHRLDANTSGLVLFSPDKSMAAILHQQFAKRQITKIYLARVHGHPPLIEFLSETRIGKSPCEAGARLPDPQGQEARTEFRVLHLFEDGTSLIEARPITGRTNQIRLHLWDLGFPILGDPIYLPNQKMGRTQTLSMSDPPLRLHALRLEFRHPQSEEKLTYETEIPEWAG